MVTTDHHKKKKKPKNRKTKKPKNRKTKKRETRYYTDDYSLPGSLHWFCVFFIFIFCKWNIKF